MYKIPSFEECLKIVEGNECFTHRIREVKGFQVSIFDYLLAGYNDFIKPLPDSDITATELRGLAFVHNLDGTKTRYILLHKFFNLNQVESTQYVDMKQKKIRKVMDKMDGSVTSFVRLPNNEIVIKTKTFFDNDQTAMGQAFYDANPNWQGFIKDTLDQGLIAITELTSAQNRIVLSYKKTELTLLQLRDQETGEYFDIYSHPLVKKWNINCVKKIEIYDLDTLIELALTVENIEGWVIEFEDGTLIKLKCAWYCALHGLVEKISLEDKIMEMIITNTIDDALAQLDWNDPRRDVINQITQAYSHYVAHKVKSAIEFSRTYAGNRKDWVLQYKKDPLFHYAIKVVDIQDETKKEEKVLASVQADILQETYYLNKARRFITEELKCPLLIQYSAAVESEE